MRLHPVHLLAFAGCLILCVLVACTPAPEGSQFWGQVNREYESRDYRDTLNYLNDVLQSENDYNARASALKVVILGGMTRSGLAIEAACDKGTARVPAWNQAPFKNCIEQFRWQARTRALDLIDALNEFEKVTSDSAAVPLDFPLPEGSSRRSSMLGRAEAGALPPEKAFDSAVALVVDHHIFLQVSDFVTADDAAAVTTMFEARPVEVPKEAFLVGIAKTLLSAAAVFDKDRLDDSAKKSATLERAKQSLQPALEGSDKALQTQAKELARQIRNKSRH